jgi:small subunit ribosomal protein S7e
MVGTFSGVYKKLTGKDVNWEFPEFYLLRKWLNKVTFIVNK